MELNPIIKIIIAAKQHLSLDKATHKTKPRCDKCVYELYCSKDKDKERKCSDYKRDAPDGGYYG